MTEKEKYWKYTLIVTLIVVGYILFVELSRFLPGLLGACTIYVLVRKHMEYLTEKKSFKNGIAATVIIVEVALCFLVPAFLVIWLVVNQIQSINLDTTALISKIQELANLMEKKVNYNILSSDNISAMATFLTSVGQLLINQISSFVVNSLVMIFILYFMLYSKREMENYLYEILPFSDKNKKYILSETKLMVTSNALGIPLLAIIQGVIATIGYFIFDVPTPIIFGFVTCFASIIPFVGTGLVWLPIIIYLVLIGDWANAIGLTLYSLLIISNIDNLVRFMLQKKIANIHPLITVFGAFMGLSLFGFWGVIFGPLLLSLFLLCFNIFKKEYLEKDI